jgi:TetR/AcrR family tetracycline transcriptional repressor
VRSAGRKNDPGTNERPLGRDEILAAALRLVDQEGLEALSLRRLASDLGVTPAAVHWHVRSKDELIRAIVSSVFIDFLPPPCDTGSWVERLRELHLWLRAKFLSRMKILRSIDVRHVMAYAFMKIGTTSSGILTEAGFTGDRLGHAVCALLWHTTGFAIFESSLFTAYSPATSRRLALNRAISILPPEELKAFVEHLPHLLDFDVDELFRSSLDLLLDGMHAQLDRPHRKALPSQAPER